MENESITCLQQVFRNYRRALLMMYQCERFRNKRKNGIAVDMDFHARRWRKYEALSKRQEKIIHEGLG